MRSVILALFITFVIGSGCAHFESTPSASPSSATISSDRENGCVRGGGRWRAELALCEHRSGGS